MHRLLSDAAGRGWVASRFGPVQRSLDGLSLGAITYPQFLVAPDGRLQLSYRTGLPHVVISYVPGRFTQCVTSYAANRTSWGRAFHVWRDAAGAWRKMEIPVPLNSTGRSQLVLDAQDNAYVVLPFGRVVAASRASGWTDWTVRFDGAGLNAFGEVVVDRARVDSEGVLSILYQQRSSGTTPSPLGVVDLRLG